MACEAFLEFQLAYPDYDPQGLKERCQITKDEKSTQTIAKLDMAAAFRGMLQMEWCEIPAGTVMVEDPRNHQDKRWTLDAYEISKYPITNQQFTAFVGDPEGYCDARWWRLSRPAFQWFQEHPTPLEPHFNGDDRPRETVNWYEAIAFCNWLGYRLESHIILPNLAQWQRAAFGDDERLYPWGNQFVQEACNTRESGLKMTTSVKRYSAGVSPFGAYDMAGNVWEWCMDKLEPEEGAQDYRRAVIGGSFVSPCDRAQSAFRYFLNPEARYSSIGFRVIRLPKGEKA
jgi:formylglycine-generating enzyme required for sulfatase activity